jgi:hypothetical protein
MDDGFESSKSISCVAVDEGRTLLLLVQYLDDTLVVGHFLTYLICESQCCNNVAFIAFLSGVELFCGPSVDAMSPGNCKSES